MGSWAVLIFQSLLQVCKILLHLIFWNNFFLAQKLCKNFSVSAIAKSALSFFYVLIGNFNFLFFTVTRDL